MSVKALGVGGGGGLNTLVDTSAKNVIFLDCFPNIKERFKTDAYKTTFKGRVHHF